MDLKQILDPNARHVFFTSGSLSYVYPIVHVDQNYLYFSSEKPLPENFDSGHFLAQDGAGIVQFAKPEIDALKKEVQASKNITQYLYRLDFDAMDFSITNRRQSMRYEFTDFVPISFNVFGENISAQLINISEGGLRMCVDTPLKKNVLCQLEIKIPSRTNEIYFKTNGIITYADHEEGTKKIFVGISFVSPEFNSNDEKDNYLETKMKLRKFISEKEHTI